MLPNLGVTLRRYGDVLHVALYTRLIELALVVCAIAADLRYWTLDVLQQLTPCFRVVNTGFRQDDRFDSLRGLINAQVQLAPGAVFAVPMLADLPFAFTVDFQSGAVDDNVFWAIVPAWRQLNRQVSAAQTQRTVIRDLQVDAQHVEQRLPEALRLTVWQLEHRAQRQHARDGLVRIAHLSTASAWPFRLRMPVRQNLVVDPHRQRTALHQTLVVLRPVTYAIRCFLCSCRFSVSFLCHASSLTWMHSFNKAVSQLKTLPISGCLSTQKVQNRDSLSLGTVIQSLISPYCQLPACNPSLILNQNGGDTDGYVLTGGGNIDTNFVSDLQTDQIDENRHYWYARLSDTPNHQDYTYFAKLLRLPLNPEIDFGAAANSASKPTGDFANEGAEAYFHSGNLTLGNAWDIAADETVIVMVDGNVNVAAQTSVEEGGYFMIVATGDIVFDAELGHDDPALDTAVVEGVFVANGQIRTPSLGEAAGGDKKSVGEGTFVGWNGFSLERDYDDGAGRRRLNNTAPVEYFRYRPDFLKNAPDTIKRPQYSWREINP